MRARGGAVVCGCLRCGTPEVTFEEDYDRVGVVYRCPRCGAPSMASTPGAVSRYRQDVFVKTTLSIGFAVVVFGFMGFMTLLCWVGVWEYGALLDAWRSGSNLRHRWCTRTNPRTLYDDTLAMARSFTSFAAMGPAVLMYAFMRMARTFAWTKGDGVMLPVDPLRLERGEKRLDTSLWVEWCTPRGGGS